MSAWDPSLVDPTTRPADGLLIKAVGGRTGTLELENGAKLRFPFKSQQQISGSAAPRIQSYEIDSGGQHTLHLQIAGAVMDANSPYIDMKAPFPDETDEPSLYLSSGAHTGSDTAAIRLGGHATLGTIELYGAVTGFDSLAIDSITNRVGTLAIDSSAALTLTSGGTLTLQPDANQNLALTTTGTGDMNLTAGDTFTLGAGNYVYMASGSGDPFEIASGGDLLLSGGSGYDVTIGTSGLGIVDIGDSGTTRIGNGSGTITIGSTTATINMAGYLFSGQWTDYTPTLSQNGTVTHTITYCRYRRYGRTVIYQGYIVATAAGTAGQVISVSLPVTAAIASFHPVGTFYFYDASPGTNYAGVSLNRSTTSLGFLVDREGEVGNSPSLALASGDQIKWEVTYEASAN